MISVLSYYLANQPLIVNFRWSHSQSVGSTWSFLISSLSLYLLLSLSLAFLLRRLIKQPGKQQKAVIPLGPIPAVHSLLLSVLSLVIFLGLSVSSLHEIKETRWLWRRTKTSTSFQWLLCFPLGTRPSGRVFFWSHLFYLSRYLHLLRTFFSILRRPHRPIARRLFSHSSLILMSFLWLEFTQSVQVLAILSATLAQVVLFGYKFWLIVSTGGTSASASAAGNSFPSVLLACHFGMLACNLVGHLGFLMFHFSRGGCSGLEAWLFNSFLNAALLMLFLNCYVNKRSSSKTHHPQQTSSSSSSSIKVE